MSKASLFKLALSQNRGMGARTQSPQDTGVYSVNASINKQDFQFLTEIDFHAIVF